MRWIKIFIYLIVIYGIFRQPVHFSSLKQEDQNSFKVKRIQTFLHSYNSPLEDNSMDFINASKKYKIPAQTLIAISGVESTFGKNCNSFNPFGYLNSDGSLISFSSYKEAIYQVAKTISGGKAYQKYRDTKSIYELAKVYNYVSPDKWTQDIQYFQKALAL